MQWNEIIMMIWNSNWKKKYDQMSFGMTHGFGSVTTTQIDF